MESYSYHKELKRIIALTGHYGCGKTNLALNLAVEFRSLGEEVTIVDLDIVNPYFLTSDYTDMLEALGIRVISSGYAGTQIETPSIPREISAAIVAGQGRLIIDVGGDDVGARALGRFHGDIDKTTGIDLLYLFSIYRPQTGTALDVKRHIEAIEIASRQKVGYLVNSSNLGADTQIEDVEESNTFAEHLSEYLQIPLLFTLAKEEINKEGYHMVKRYVKLPWETSN